MKQNYVIFFVLACLGLCNFETEGINLMENEEICDCVTCESLTKEKDKMSVVKFNVS
jgi:hypothetical protein